MPVIALQLLLFAASQAQGSQESQASQRLQPSQEWRVEAPLLLTASAPASNVETTVAPWIGLRAGTLSLDGAGFDGAVYFSTVRDGTPEVATSRTIVVAEARGLFAPTRFASTFTALVPYGFLGASAGGGVLEVKAFEDSRFRPLATWAARAGLGAELQVHRVSTRIELGAGLRDLRFEITSALSLGVAF